MGKNLTWYISKFGLEEGTKKHNSWKNNIGKSSKNRCTLDGFIQRYGEIDGIEKFNSFKSKSVNSKQSFEKRYGDQGKEKWEKYIQDKKEKSKRSIKYWLIKCEGDYEEARDLLAIYQKRDLNFFTAKYGEFGAKIFKERCEKHSQFMKKYISENGSSGYSNISQKFFKMLNLNDEHTYFASLNKEFTITHDGKNYSYDFVNTTHKICIEFNGDFWHCNPEYVSSNFFHPVKKLKAEQIWKLDEQKNRIIENMGYRVIIVWESEFVKNPTQVVEKIKKIWNL